MDRLENRKKPSFSIEPKTGIEHFFRRNEIIAVWVHAKLNLKHFKSLKIKYYFTREIFQLIVYYIFHIEFSESETN